MAKIIVQKKEITVVTVEDKDYISLTDMANAKESESRAATWPVTLLSDLIYLLRRSRSFIYLNG